ncbi:E3 ubiquitin-protein ligase PUB23-like [Cornus florida]|uniref:E3 ubiquitin-protein ligase PUB23-like n=1 Tax=Cornus florida TaxID=4283 RepID=UPI0028977CE3|nr:E3 ubiquitin-protein ligase PUB23-like [Cornus florida]
MSTEIEVPPYFLCPISLEIMKDPVIVPTGITYDRESIEKWIFSGKNNTCPVTKQVLSDPDMTPNHTLRRLIQSWCTINASYGIERFPTPKPPVSKPQIVKLINNAKSLQHQMQCLRKLRSIASENEANKRCMEASGAAEFLVSIIINNSTINNASSAESEKVSSDEGLDLTTTTSDEALSILYHLQLSEVGLKSLIGQNGTFIDTLMRVMQSGNYESRAYAVLLLKNMFEVADPMQMITFTPEFFVQVVQVLRDQISFKASKASLQLLSNLGPWGRNRVKIVDAGAVSVLIDFLLETSEKRDCEMMMVVLDQLCQCAEGRAELLKHGAGLAIVSKKILRVSKMASERAVKILFSISKFSASPSVLQEMLQLGVVAKLCLVLQVDCGTKTKEKAREILKLHARAWKNSPCMPMNMISSYPS